MRRSHFSEGVLCFFCTGLIHLYYLSHRRGLLVNEGMTLPASSQTPLNYHKALKKLLKTEYAEVWKWFSSVKARTEYGESVELELLKSTYRMERDAHKELYQLVDEVCQALEIEVPVTLYQSQGAQHLSAALYFTPGHGHVVLVGAILDLLNPAEMKALIAHELSHFKLWTIEDGDYLVCDQVLTAMANEPRAEGCHLQSARLYQLYTEIYADRGALSIVDDEVIVSMLLKVHTGLKEADANSYLKQAEDIFSKEKVSTEGLTHPELFIRVRAIQLMDLNEPEAYDTAIESLIEGELSLDEVDMLAQVKLTEQTKQFFSLHLQPEWLRTEAVMSHVGYFFADFEVAAESDLVPFNLDAEHPKVRDYFCYLLVDLAAVDQELEEYGVAASILTAEKLGVSDRLDELLNKELKILKKTLKRLRKDAADMVKVAAAESEEKSKKEVK